MEKRTKAVSVILAALILSAVGMLAYYSTTAPAIDVVAYEALSTNPGLSVNASSTVRHSSVGENITVSLSLSPSWPVALKSLYAMTSGFSVVSINASLPLLVDQNMTISAVLRSNQSYSGTVLLIVGSVNVSELSEKILVPDVATDTWTKTVTLVSVYNAGDVPLANSTAFLVRSDGLVVNSTPLHTEGLLPGKISYFYIDMSYQGATLIEIYRVNVVTATGANATSRVFPLTCNC
jgi:hypothetical protein